MQHHRFIHSFELVILTFLEIDFVYTDSGE